jgi:hypothetical protein
LEAVDRVVDVVLLVWLLGALALLFAAALKPLLFPEGAATRLPGLRTSILLVAGALAGFAADWTIAALAKGSHLH